MTKTPTKILEKNQRWRERNREKLLEYNRRYYQARQAERKEDARKRYQEKPEAWKLNHRKRRTLLREALFEKFGSVCARCGFNDWRALQIDHINGGGTQERKQYKNRWSYYYALLDAPEGTVQMLCANCNQIKMMESHGYTRE